MSTLNSKERLDLKKLISQSDSEDNTEHIRKVKHSVLIRNDIRLIDQLKKTERNTLGEDGFKELCQSKCPFLFLNYTDIFTRLIKDELDLTIMTKLLTVLKLIEDNKVDQHEGSVMVGKVLKELYIDSAIKHGENLDKQRALESDEVVEPPIEGKPISWKEFKSLNST
jgi:hypothetical protein